MSLSCLVLFIFGIIIHNLFVIKNHLEIEIYNINWWEMFCIQINKLKTKYLLGLKFWVIYWNIQILLTHKKLGLIKSMIPYLIKYFLLNNFYIYRWNNSDVIQKVLIEVECDWKKLRSCRYNFVQKWI